MLLSKFPPPSSYSSFEDVFHYWTYHNNDKNINNNNKKILTYAIFPGSKRTSSTEHENHTTIYAKNQCK